MSFSGLASQRRRWGFTLVEILIVLAIIGILAALLFPVFRSVRDGARTASCASNLRQISLALQLYVADNNGRYPSIGPLNGNRDCCWADQIIAYAGSPGIFTCPSLDHDADYRPGCPPDEVINDKAFEYNGSYVQNWLRVGKEGWRAAGTRESRLVRPSRTMLVLEGESIGVGYITPGGVDGDDEPVPIRTLLDAEKLGVAIPGRHRGGNNVLFADGHIKWMPDKAMTDQSLWFISAASEPKITDGE